MSFRNALEAFHYDVPKSDLFTVYADVRGPIWKKALAFPFGTVGWSIENRGSYRIRVGFEEDDVHFDTMTKGVLHYRPFVPRELWFANEEVTVGRDTVVRIEWWTPEAEEDRKKNEPTARQQLEKRLTLVERVMSILRR